MTNTADALTPPRVRTDGNQEKAATRTRRARTSSGEESDGGARFFLPKPGGNDGLPGLNREVANESEALVEALRLGVTFYHQHGVASGNSWPANGCPAEIIGFGFLARAAKRLARVVSRGCSCPTA